MNFNIFYLINTTNKITFIMTNKLDPILIRGDYVEVIAKFLDPLDIVNVCKAYCPNWKRRGLYLQFMESARKNIDGFFRDYFKEKYPEFRKMMIKSKTVISGSFIIQMILRETWSNSDIDMYILHSPQNKGTLLEHGSWTTNMEDFLYRDHDGDIEVKRCTARYDQLFWIMPERCRMKSTRIDQIREYGSNDTSLFSYFQVISFKHDDSNHDAIQFFRDLVKYHFDLNVCKNTFHYDEDGPHVWISAIKDIVEKNTPFKQGYSSDLSKQRALKYVKRGFIVRGLDPHD